MKRIVIGVILELILLAGQGRAEDFYYYTCSYADSIAPSRILFTRIDLNEKRIACSSILNFDGFIIFKNPLKISSGKNNYFTVMTGNGLWGKNCKMLGSDILNYALLDRSCTTISRDSIDNIFISSTTPDSPNWDSTFTFGEGRGVEEIDYKGRFLLDSHKKLQVIKSKIANFDYADYVPIDRFKYYNRVSPDNRQLFWEIISDGLYLLKLNLDEKVLMDTIRIDSAIRRLYLFGLSENDSLVYAFYMNYNILDPNPEYQKSTIDPSYVKIFSFANFSLVDSINIHYPPLDSGYVMGTTWSVDRAGPYFVYFDLTQEDPNYFSPAMLFIFDIRTNETTWLRVGWR